jgi:hypothetical protein
MNFQTITVTIAFVAGLALALLTSGGIMPGTFTSPATGNQIGYWIGHKVGELCVLPLIFALIATAATAYWAGLRRSMLNVLGAVTGAVVVPLVIVYGAYAVAATRPQKDLPFAEAGESRASFIKGTLSTCTRKQREAPQNKALSAAAIETFCSCVGNELADVITRTEAAAIEQHQTLGPGFFEKTNAASLKCSQLVQGPR